MENYIVNTFVHISLGADILPHLLEFYKVNKTFKIIYVTPLLSPLKS